MVKNIVLRDIPNESSSNEDEEDDEGSYFTKNEPLMKVLPQTPSNRRMNADVDRHRTTPGRVANANPSMTKAEVIRILGINREFYSREVRVKYKTLSIKCHHDKWNERRDFTKNDGVEIFKGTVNAFDILK